MDDDLGSGLLETIESTSPSVFRTVPYFLVSIYLIYSFLSALRAKAPARGR